MLSINCKGRLITFDEPRVMGIINFTPDSFYSGSRIQAIDKLLAEAEKMLTDGTTFIDIGGQSTRPNSERINSDKELSRVIPAIEAILKRFPEALISIDTYYAKVAKEAVAAGACIVNDISAGSMDENLIETVIELNIPYVLMHMKGTPETMQQQAMYEDVVLEVFDFLSFKTKELQQKGIKDIIVDVGFGFAKTAEHNFNLLQSLSYFQHLDVPVLAGLSRKATIYKTLGIDATEALNGTTVLNTIALLNGASLLRVHDVKEAVQAIKLVTAYKKIRSSYPAS
ncbi:MAG: dihydropteroate synthase [Chitinophagaceae bacterium]